MVGASPLFSFVSLLSYHSRSFVYFYLITSLQDNTKGRKLDEFWSVVDGDWWKLGEKLDRNYTDVGPRLTKGGLEE